MSRIKHFDYSRGSAHVPADPRGGSGPCSSARDHGMNQKTKQKSREAIAGSTAALLTNYHDASDWAALEATFRQVSITRQRISSHPPAAELQHCDDPYSFRIADIKSKLARPLLRLLHIFTKSATNVFAKRRLTVNNERRIDMKLEQEKEKTTSQWNLPGAPKLPGLLQSARVRGEEIRWLK
jgi:hypothetical protein